MLVLNESFTIGEYNIFTNTLPNIYDEKKINYSLENNNQVLEKILNNGKVKLEYVNEMWTITYIPNEIFDSNEITYSVNENIVFYSNYEDFDNYTENIYNITVKNTPINPVAQNVDVHMLEDTIVILPQLFFIYDINDPNKKIYMIF